jgi:hypothetical protein
LLITSSNSPGVTASLNESITESTAILATPLKCRLKRLAEYTQTGVTGDLLSTDIETAKDISQ